jgi:hypothetical protein
VSEETLDLNFSTMLEFFKTVRTLGDGQNAFCAMKWTCPWVGQRYYALNMKCSPQDHMNTWSPSGDTVLRGSGCLEEVSH